MMVIGTEMLLVFLHLSFDYVDDVDDVFVWMDNRKI